MHSKNWHTCHKLDNLLLVQTLELSNNLQEPLCLPPLSSSPTIAFHTVYQYLDLPTPHSCIHVITVDGPISTHIWKILGCCGNAKGHCRNDATKGALRQCASILRQIRIAAMLKALQAASALQQYCGNTSIETGIAAIR